MLPKKTKYAIKALFALAKTFEQKQPQRIADIAENENIPKKFLEAILLDMRKIGIVNSKMEPMEDITFPNIRKKSISVR